MGQRNGWLGGDGDVWERGPYWIDGLLPLAYILDNKELKQKYSPGLNGHWLLKSLMGTSAPIPTKATNLACKETMHETGGPKWLY